MSFAGFINALSGVPPGSFVWNDIIAINQHGDAGGRACRYCGTGAHYPIHVTCGTQGCRAGLSLSAEMADAPESCSNIDPALIPYLICIDSIDTKNSVNRFEGGRSPPEKLVWYIKDGTSRP